jgi:hypothetical protein
MSCATEGTSYNINGSVYSVPTTPSIDEQDVCRATQIIERLHKDFTEKYDTANIGSAVTKPSYYLRFQPTSATDNAQVNRFYANLTNSTANNNEYNGITYYRRMISAIMKGENDTAAATYESVPDSIRTQVNFDSSANFKGIYGVNRVIEILEQKINGILVGLSPSASSASSSALTADSITKFGQRKDIKNTLEEVAYRENQIYREKFLNIILIVVGIFVVGSQLVQRYFSGGEGGGGGGAGLGGLFGFGFGGSGGLFSRFGGLGLGSSGRSHFDIGNLFKNSSYALKQR